MTVTDIVKVREKEREMNIENEKDFVTFIAWKSNLRSMNSSPAASVEREKKNIERERLYCYLHSVRQ